MAIRLSGMNSGLDTDAIVQELVKAKSAKKTTLEQDQKKHSWKQDAWKDLNTKIYGFYSKTLSNTRLQSDYFKKTTKASSNAVSIVTGSNAPNCVQELKIKSMAKSGYHTGAQLTDAQGKKADYKADTKLADINPGLFVKKTGEGDETETPVESRTFRFTSAGVEYSFDVTAETTLGDIAKMMNNPKTSSEGNPEDGITSGLTANFDAKNQRFFISAKGMGEENDFDYADDDDTNAILSAIGLGRQTVTDDNKDGYAGVKLSGSNAEIELNGESYTSLSNTFDINGLTITVNNTTSDTISLTTQSDTDGIYDMVKNFIKEYNTLINEFDKLYNAAAATKYKMLTDEEKEAMDDDDVKEWEDKIKSALLRGDQTLGNVSNAMKEIMLKGIEMKDGTKMHLSDFGIATAGYFAAADNEKNAYHIDGDADDTVSATATDKLKSMIANDPEKVAEFFSGLSKSLYGKLDELMGRTDYSSAFTVYNDKLMKTQYDDYKTKIADQEKKITTWEDFYYSKFTRMEKAMANMQGAQNALAGMFGGN